MSTRELRRAEVLGRVKSKALRLTDAAKIPADEETLVSKGRSEGSAAPRCGKRLSGRDRRNYLRGMSEADH
jgi:hypothetical protein